MNHPNLTGLSITKAKQAALLDITKEYKRNYVSIESIVLKSLTFNFEYIPIINLNQ
jgi:hypothetical protein